MKVGIMQPYFFPYLGYFSLIKHTDRFLLFDVVQFIRHGWIERNRILKPGAGWQYISVPLIKHNRDTIISEIQIRNTEDWQLKIIRQLEHYKKAPFYKEAISIIEECLSFKTDSIVELNCLILQKICDYLYLDKQIEIFSNLNIELGTVNAPGDWAYEITKAINGTTYYNPPGGEEIFDIKKFKDAEINICFLSNKLESYNQRRATFENGLSIIDVLMFNSAEKVNYLIDQIELNCK